jgi:CAP12/Pycsar effector protein, TIR domain/Deacetylase PdaC
MADSDELAPNPRAVFVVHGRNQKARRAMFSFLRSLGLQPLEWNHLIRLSGGGSPYVGDVINAGFQVAKAAIVLFTPDDEAQLREKYRSIDEPSYETILTPQARPNVIFEAGMAMGITPSRTIIVEFGSIRPISDLHGRHIIRMNNSYARRNDLLQRLEAAGCLVDSTGDDWTSEGDFDQIIDDLVPTSPQTQAAIHSLNPGYSIEVLREVRKRGTEEYSVEYPAIQGLSNSYLERRLNTLLENTIKRFMGLINEEGSPTEPDEDIEDRWEHPAWSSFEVTLATPDLLSVRVHHSIGGGAHPINSTLGITIDMHSGYRYSVFDLFKTDLNYRGLLHTLIRRALAQDDPKYKDHHSDLDLDERKPGLYDFVFEERELVFVNLFWVHAIHGLWARIPYSDMANVADPLGPLAALLNSRRPR